MILIDASLRISVVVAAIALVLVVLRVRASGVRHAAWMLALAAMLSMPLLTAVVPALPVPIPVSSASVPGETMFPRIAVPMDPPAPARLERPTPVTSAASHAATAPTPASSRWSLADAAILIYVAGLLVLLVRFLAGWRAAARLARTATPVTIACDVSVRESSAVVTPLTAGILSPAIVLPSTWREWPEEKLRACLAHERAHVQRRDSLVGLLAHVNRCIYWFHPVAWWLERALRAAAEDAADEAAVKAIGQPRRYAELLLDIAESVRRQGGRVTWQTVGADGSGRLGRRVDRVLSGAAATSSRMQTAVVLTACIATILVVVACRQPQRRVPPPLAPNPEVAERLEEQKKQLALHERAKNMTAADVDALEASLKRTADDLEKLKQLRTFYQTSGQKVFGWDETIKRRRPHILWVIEHHPDHEAAVWPVSPQADPVTYAEAKTRWLAHVAKPDASTKVLRHAASFLQQGDPKAAERLIVRLKDSGWLGRFYGEALGRQRLPEDERRELRQRLLTSTDAPLLMAASQMLVFSSATKELDFAVQLMERAAQLDPTNQRAQQWLASRRESEQTSGLSKALRMKSADLAGAAIAEKVRTGQRLTEDEGSRLEDVEEQAMAQLPDADRFVLLPRYADLAYSTAEYRDHIGQKDKAAKRWARSKRYAQQALDLAAKFRDHRDYGYVVYVANTTLAANVLREGDGQQAIRLMRAAGDAPAADALAIHTFNVTPDRLVNYLLKGGERESVAQFLEKSAQLRTAERDRLLTDAAAIRAGQMPRSYQVMVSK